MFYSQAFGWSSLRPYYVCGRSLGHIEDKTYPCSEVFNLQKLPKRQGKTE